MYNSFVHCSVTMNLLFIITLNLCVYLIHVDHLLLSFGHLQFILSMAVKIGGYIINTLPVQCTIFDT